MPCIDCRHYVPSSTRRVKVEEDNLIFFDSEEVPRFCALGNTAAWDAWWESVRGIPVAVARETIPSPDCFEKTEGAILLESMMESIQKLSGVLDKRITG